MYENQILRVLTAHSRKKHLLEHVTRRLRSTKQAPCEKQLDESVCKADGVCDGVQPKKKGFFGGLFAKKPKQEDRERPTREECKIEQAKQKRPKDPDLSEFGGQAYRTCGTAYVVQKQRDQVAAPGPRTKEEKVLRKIEAEPELKEKQDDPMPPFTTVEQRMMDLDARKLHPLYKKYQVTPRRMYKTNQNSKPVEYKTRSGPVDPQEYPLRLKFNRELLEKKNMYAEYKKVEPPQQLVAKILELKQNERPTLERKFPHLDAELQKAKARRNVFDTLKQKDSITEKFLKK